MRIKNTDKKPAPGADASLRGLPEKPRFPLRDTAEKAAGAIGKAEEGVSRFFGHKPTAVLLAGLIFYIYYRFALLGSFNILSMISPPRECTFQFYLCDYSVGFCSRLLLGALISLFYDTVNITLISRLANASLLACILLQSLLTGIVVRRALEKRDLLMLVISFLFVLNPLTTLENAPMNGSLDPYIMILFLVWLFFADTTAATVLAPFLGVVCMTIHYEYLFTFLPPVLALLLYKACCGETKKSRLINGCGFFTTALSSGGLFIYFVFFAKNFLKLTSDEFYEAMASRFNITANAEAKLRSMYAGNLLYRYYFDYYIFGEYEGPGDYGDISKIVPALAKYTKEHSIGAAGTFLPFVLPPLLLFAALWICCMIREKGIRRLPYLSFIGIMLALVPTVIVSTDVWRFASAVLISQFAILFTLYRDKNSALYGLMQSRFFRSRWTAAVFLLLCIPYFRWAFALEPYMLTF